MEKRRSQLDCSLSLNDSTLYYSCDDTSIYEPPSVKKSIRRGGLSRKGALGYFTTSTPALPSIGRSFAKRVLRENLSNITSDFSLFQLTNKDRSLKTLSSSIPANNKQPESNELLVEKAKQSLLILKRDTSLIISQKVNSPETIKEMGLLLDHLLLGSPKPKKFKHSQRNLRF